jgi:hypothetical protein
MCVNVHVRMSCCRRHIYAVLCKQCGTLHTACICEQGATSIMSSMCLHLLHICEQCGTLHTACICEQGATSIMSSVCLHLLHICKQCGTLNTACICKQGATSITRVFTPETYMQHYASHVALCLFLHGVDKYLCMCRCVHIHMYMYTCLFVHGVFFKACIYIHA